MIILVNLIHIYYQNVTLTFNDNFTPKFKRSPKAPLGGNKF